MEIVFCQDEKEMTLRAHEWCLERLKKYSVKRLFLPAGGTPKALYEYWELNKPDFLSKLELTQVDDIVSGPKSGFFARFFQEHLPSYQSCFVPLQEQQSPPDLVILGLGVNGHIAFHEPHVREDLFKGFVNLADDTCERLGVEPRTKGYTFGARAFCEAKAILLMVKGLDKKQVFEDFVENSSGLPVHLLKRHKDLVIVAEKAMEKI